MYERNNKNKGITLIALVITIIVLLILAGVAISMLSGENGILKKAAEAKTKTEEGQKQEETALTSMELETYFQTENKKYKCSNGFITGITLGTKVSEFQSVLPDGYTVKAIDETDNFTAKDPTDGQPIVATGLAIQKDNKTVARTVIFGEVNGNGKINIADAGEINTILMVHVGTIEDYKIMAADVNHNGIIDKNDADIIKSIVLGEKYNIDQNKYVSKLENLIANTGNVIKDEYFNLFKERVGMDYDEGVYILKGTSADMTVKAVLELLGNEENIIITDESLKEKAQDDKLVLNDEIVYKHSDGRKIEICYAL